MELPEGCIADIISRTTPLDACRVTLVSKLFRSAADSDSVWCRFLPSDVVSIVSQSDDSSLLASSPSKKALFLALSDRPIIFEEGKKSFQLERKSGKKCYMIASRALHISWGETPQYWRWITMPESRFPEVAQLICVCWLEIRGVINTMALTPNTQYAAYLVFKMVELYGFHKHRVELSVGILGGKTSTRSVYLQGKRQRPRNTRRDGWLEVEMGLFFNSGIENEEVLMSVLEIKGGRQKGGLTIQGIEIRPKDQYGRDMYQFRPTLR